VKEVIPDNLHTKKMLGRGADMDSIQAKQYYLRRNILEEGYDADEFGEYLSVMKPDGFDLNTWTMAELKAVVQKYKSLKEKPNVDPEEAEDAFINGEKSLPTEFQDFPQMDLPQVGDLGNSTVDQSSIPPQNPLDPQCQPNQKNKASRSDLGLEKENNFDDISDPYERMMRIVTQYEIKCKPM
jgi:hypothetical protein